MRKIKIAFKDFWDGFDEQHNFITEILCKHYMVDIITDTDRREDVEYLFYSCMGKEHLKYNCIRIFYTGENFTPDFNICDYAIGFDEMEFGDRYLRYPVYLAFYQEDYKKMLDKNKIISDEENKKFCSFVVSQSNIANPIREEFFYKLNEYKKVDSGGRFLNNIGMPEGVKDKWEFQKQYKFAIAFENASHPGYCTEKIVQAFAAGTIPIYWGDPRVEEYFNEKAFINCLKFSSIDDVIACVKDLDQDDELYLSMRREKAIVRKEQSLENYTTKLESWLLNIFEQDLEQARRVNQYGKQLLYKRELQFEYAVMQKFASIEREKTNTLKGKLIRKLRLLKR